MKNVPDLEEVLRRQDNSPLAAPDAAAGAIREAIVTGALRGGTTVRQDEVARILGLSKAPVREALRELVADGLVEPVKNRGFIVTEMSSSEMQEMFRIRESLECIAIELSMPFLAETDILSAEDALNKLEDVEDTTWICRLNLDFHMALYRPSGAKQLLRMIRHAHYISHRYVHASFWLAGVSLGGQDEHRAILEACKRRSSARARELIRQHVINAREDLSDKLKKYLNIVV